MKTYLCVLYKGSGFYGPFLCVAEDKKQAVRYAVREIINRGKFPTPEGDNTLKAVCEFVKRAYVTSEKAGLKPVEVQPYGNGFTVVYDKKKDKINLTEV